MHLQRLLIIGMIGLASWTADAQVKAIQGHESPNSCGPIFGRHYGPYDYRNQRPQLEVVETYHFTPTVEAGVRGESGLIGDDLNYTLRAAPNHHRALVTLTRLAETKASLQIDGMLWPMECYYDRALRFRPDDLVVRMLYALFLKRQKRPDDALRQLEFVAANAGDSAMTHFNVGMVYADFGVFDKALEQAHLAARLGDPRQGLADRLKASGKWVDAPAEAASAASASSSAPSSPAN